MIEFLFDESDIPLFEFLLSGTADRKFSAVIQYKRVISQAADMFHVHKNAEMAAAEPFPIQAGEQIGKILVDIQYLPPLQVDSRFMAGSFCIEDVFGIHSLPASIHQKFNLFRMIIIPQIPVDYSF